MQKDLIKTIRNNPQNSLFFKNAGFHGDKAYSIEVKDGKKVFRVKTENGYAHYELKGSVIGNYTHL